MFLELKINILFNTTVYSVQKKKCDTKRFTSFFLVNMNC